MWSPSKVEMAGQHLAGFVKGCRCWFIVLEMLLFFKNSISDPVCWKLMFACKNMTESPAVLCPAICIPVTLSTRLECVPKESRTPQAHFFRFSFAESKATWLCAEHRLEAKNTFCVNIDGTARRSMQIKIFAFFFSFSGQLNNDDNNNGHFYSTVSHKQGWAHCALEDLQKCIHYKLKIIIIYYIVIILYKVLVHPPPPPIYTEGMTQGVRGVGGGGKAGKKTEFEITCYDIDCTSLNRLSYKEHYRLLIWFCAYSVR